MATPTHVVVRSFPGPDGRAIEPGAVVEASGWRNTDALVRRRYLRPIDKPAQTIAAPRPIQVQPTTKRGGR